VGNVLRSAGRVFDPSIAITSARLPDGTFVNVVMPPRAVKGPAITLRKRRKSVPTLAELVGRGMLSQPMADFLQMCVRARQNIVICGGLRSGRTTLLNALAACIPDTERIVTLEDLAELQLPQKQVVSLEARVIEPGSAREHESMRDLLQCALRMRPERLIMGDCWNDEAGVLLSALHTGYDGSLFNIYANGLQDCLSRLEMMWLASRSSASLLVVREQLARAVNLIVYLAHLSDGPRKVMNIAEVIGVQGDRIKARTLFHYLEDSDGQGSFEPGFRVSSSSILNSSR
jgi:pilus assembly protein CpaF